MAEREELLAENLGRLVLHGAVMVEDVQAAAAITRQPHVLRALRGAFHVVSPKESEDGVHSEKPHFLIQHVGEMYAKHKNVAIQEVSVGVARRKTISLE